MTRAALKPDTDVIEGVYLCTSLDLPDLFGPALAGQPGLRLYKPDDVPDPSRIRFALVWRPADNAFDAYPNIDLVQVIAAGVDGVLRNPSLPDGVVVTRVHDTEQATIMAGFAAWHVVWHHRHMGNYLDAQKSRTWDRTTIKTLRPPSEVTVGLLGYGLMGRTIARTVASMGFPVLAATRTEGNSDPGVTRVSGADAVKQVAAQSDILINILPLTGDTHDILNADLFAAMPSGAALIHLGRGPHLVEADLLEALDKGQIGGASLDVFRQEPLPSDHPFWTHPRIVITPHEASVTSPQAVTDALVRSIRELDAGERPTATVDKTTGY
ncbi:MULTISPECIES: 2-hydroxyacid dehydrogenase [Marivita]|uniref:Glyoxylate/hydroxypyruvate reductase A n=2 Tax=Marivita cryptomonadis TaxID=505252 RepID=A0A9Q2P862_9RHOB|nr:MULTISPECIES: glyoxylate/hydroxypyruvate reductase A [Marivita]MCR9169258.1 glyoxylate/hydroxypyruvate reductase A [Paracoccaceae bacterium]MBM2324009.1 glyoxylate/hydroxypyruvate reductase A [Marivita cryptomonadis]MBM2333598.1 glyoxylate/hydroxypyruvate reductase A [Marivita cryptomonadis]MBM2343176.1 glyoxylate/hydroxypyruvate reductase A [Marivita cryptomonadis]MBM2347847.1 glyoxylate/hydroxypyruvate reductase A [Marivita cryptomonadis]